MNNDPVTQWQEMKAPKMGDDQSPVQPDAPDAQLIAAARNVLPDLLVEIEQLRNIVETDPFETLWHKAEAERDEARARLAAVERELQAMNDAVLRAAKGRGERRDRGLPLDPRQSGRSTHRRPGSSDED